MAEVEEFLSHYGVKGMRWGVRKDRPGGVSRRVDRDARKDAAEFARAKAFYGQGAGTRRKLIKQTIEGKSKRIPGYQKALDYHLDKQDPSKHASKAISERKSKDRRDKTKKSAGAIARMTTGEAGTQAAFTAAVIGGAAYLNSPQGRTKAKQAANSLSKAANEIKRQKGAAHIANYIKKNM